MSWTLDRIRKLSPNERARLYANAIELSTEEAQAVADTIRTSGLSLIDGTGIDKGHPIVKAIRAIVYTAEAREACLKAVNEGLPPLAGVDAMLAEALPVDYGKHNQTTDWAGHFVADVMREFGYRKQGARGKMPEGSIAQTGELWKRSS